MTPLTVTNTCYDWSSALIDLSQAEAVDRNTVALNRNYTLYARWLLVFRSTDRQDYLLALLVRTNSLMGEAYKVLSRSHRMPRSPLPAAILFSSPLMTYPDDTVLGQDRKR